MNVVTPTFGEQLRLFSKIKTDTNLNGVSDHNVLEKLDLQTLLYVLPDHFDFTLFA